MDQSVQEVSLPAQKTQVDHSAQKVCRPAQNMQEDLGLRILMERLRLLDSQRQLAALRCQNFAEMMESALAGHTRGTPPAHHAQEQCSTTEEDCYWSQPCSSPSRTTPSDSVSRSAQPQPRGPFGAEDYYSTPARRQYPSQRHSRKSTRRHSMDL